MIHFTAAIQTEPKTVIFLFFFLEFFYTQPKLLHSRRSRRSWQISGMHMTHLKNNTMSPWPTKIVIWGQFRTLGMFFIVNLPKWSAERQKKWLSNIALKAFPGLQYFCNKINFEKTFREVSFHIGDIYAEGGCPPGTALSFRTSEAQYSDCRNTGNCLYLFLALAHFFPHQPGFTRN